MCFEKPCSGSAACPPPEAVGHRGTNTLPLHHSQLQCSNCRGKNLFPVPLVDRLSGTAASSNWSVMAISDVTPQSQWVSAGTSSHSHLSSPHSLLFWGNNKQRLEKWGWRLRKWESWRSPLPCYHLSERLCLTIDTAMNYLGVWGERIPETVHF